MQKEIEEVQAKEHIIYALKKYIQEKKKSINVDELKVNPYSRTKSFLSRVKDQMGKNKIQRSHFYGQTLR